MLIFSQPNVAQVRAQEFDRRADQHLFGLAAHAQTIGIKIGITVNLYDACGKPVSVREILVGVHQEITSVSKCKRRAHGHARL
jgi:hypothetical protein